VFRRPTLLHLLGYLLFWMVAAAGCSKSSQGYFQGYVEGEYVYVASPLAVQLEELAVSRGMMVKAADHLFTLEHSAEAAAVAEAEQQVQRAESLVADLTKGKRPTEIAAIAAKLDQAKSSYSLARVEFERRQKLYETKSIPKEQLDQASTEMARNAALVDELTADLKTAKLGGRPDAIEAARSEQKAAKDRLTQSRWKLEQKTQAAPQAGYVQDTFYVAGEFVPASYPVVSILPPGNVKIRFFVPEQIAGTLKPGQRVVFDFDGAKKKYQAAITYISTQAEYTPPIIYSRETRSKLVFMIEATPASKEEAAGLNPGQPIDVYLEPPHG